MYATVRKYRLNPIFEKDFVRTWHDLRRKLIEGHFIEHGILHRESKISYLSYIHWYSQEGFESYIQDIPNTFKADLQKIDEYCNNNILLHKMTVLSNNSEFA